MIDLDVEMDLIGAGDPEAFGRWVSRAEDPLRRSLRSLSARIDTEAIVQETLLRVWNVAQRVERTGPNSLLRFALRTARNLAVSELRRRGHEVTWDEGEGPADIPGQPAPPPDPFLRARIKECLGRLPSKPGAALSARLADGGARGDGDLAAGLRMTLNTFHQNLARARRLLRECLRRFGIEVA